MILGQPVRIGQFDLRHVLVGRAWRSGEPVFDLTGLSVNHALKRARYVGAWGAVR